MGSSPIDRTRKETAFVYQTKAVSFQRNKSLAGFVKCLRREIWLAPCEMPAGVRGFISFHLMHSIKFHNGRRSLFHIRRIFHFTIRLFCCIISSINLNLAVRTMNMCEWCAYKENEWLLYKSLHWSVYLADVQDYAGRCILVLNRHCGSLSELNISEWIELKTIIDRLEFVYKEVLGAELSNWSCLLNNFYKETTPNPHLHLHVRPRYKNAVVINDHSYEDTEFAHHYALKKETSMLDDDKKILYILMKKHFS